MTKEGTFVSLERLVALGSVRRTRDGALWSVPNPNAPILVMSDAEADALASLVRIQDCTSELREAQRGYERRAAPPLETLTLAPDVRAQCMFTFALEEEGLRGEVGLLRPPHAGLRGLSIHTTMRPVTTIEDGHGWPTVAAVDVAGLETTRGFDGLAERRDVGRIQRTIRAAVSARAVDMLPVPPASMGVLRLPVPFLARRSDAREAERAVPCIGIFWLTPEWPEGPTVHVEATDVIDPFRRPRLAKTDAAHHRVLPIAGRVWVCADEKHLEPALELVFRFVVERLGPLLASASTAMRRVSPDEHAAYVWDMRLLGQRSDEDPIAELAKDRPDPILMRVASRRAPHLIDAATADAPPPAPAAAPALAPAPAPALAPAPAPAPAPTFLEGVARWVVALVTPPPEPVSESPLTQALHDALTAMELTGAPVAAVIESSRGRPVRYDAKTRRIVVNAAHATMRALEPHPARIALLLLAAVSEINRELVPVTDAEELTVIVNLLRDG
jgi:hypothetical protein